MKFTHSSVALAGSLALLLAGPASDAQTKGMPTVSSVAFSPSSIYGSQSASGTVTLSAAAPTGGERVMLSSASPSLVMPPSSVTVASGATTATFTATTEEVSSKQTVSVTGMLGLSRASGSVTLKPPQVSSIHYVPVAVSGGQPCSMNLVITVPAPSGGQVITLSSSNTAVATVPASVTVPAGATAVSAAVTSVPVDSTTSVTLTAVCSGVTDSRPLSVLEATPAAVSVTPRIASGVGKLAGSVTLSGPAGPSGVTVTLHSGNKNAVAVPSSVTIAAGKSSATFTATTSAVTGNDYTTITATANSLAVPVNALIVPSTTSTTAFKTQTMLAWWAAQQKLSAANAAEADDVYQSYTLYNGAWNYSSPIGWYDGMLPGALWLVYGHSPSSYPWAETDALDRTKGLAGESTDLATAHNTGFIIWNSYGQQERLTTGDDQSDATDEIMESAQTLSNRYSSTVGCVRSLDDTGTDTGFDVIIDNMMSIEPMFWASAHGGDPEFAEEAISHATKTMENNVRSDGSTFQEVIYDPNTGAVLHKGTIQGYSDSSTWSRGQTWAMYGFTQAYGYTGNAQFLSTAEATANYFLANLPSDDVPPYDFNAPADAAPKDSSAAAVGADALLQLSEYVSDSTLKAKYWNAGEAILTSLMSATYSADGTPEASILQHGTYTYSAGIYDVGLTWGDYYFLEALTRAATLKAP